MSFVAAFDALPLASLLESSIGATPASVRAALQKSSPSLSDFAQLISPAAGESLEELCQRSQALTRQRFGKVAPISAIHG